MPAAVSQRAPESRRRTSGLPGVSTIWTRRSTISTSDIDEGLFARTDHLLAAHREMARVDLSSTAATTRVRLLVEEQLAILTERQAAVEARLQQIRAVIIRRYRLAAAPARDRPA